MNKLNLNQPSTELSFGSQENRQQPNIEAPAQPQPEPQPAQINNFDPSRGLGLGGINQNFILNDP